MTLTDTRPDTALAELFGQILEQTPPAHSGLDRALWDRLTELGLTTITSVQGGTWADAVTALRALAEHGAQLPLAEHDLLANWLRRQAGLTVRDQPSTAVVVGGDDAVSHATWLPYVEHVMVLRISGEKLYVSEHEPASLSAGTDREPGLPEEDAVDVDPGLFWEYRLRGALARSAQISGAIASAVDLTIRYAGERVQFGRPIAAFQAVRHLAADAVAETALAMTAVDAAAAAAERDGITAPGTVAAVATAKSVSTRAATVVVCNAHQVHGAIGTTAEHPLHRRTQPIGLWSQEFGSALEWETFIADGLRRDHGSVWSWICR
ncbi:acyl-CoA dehydrogenase family protein [Mycobacterium sp. NAZ190054]|uniref:acyl-CoA dehydrogenase family protein n=1 Tax=Mycobacterium sp. NAZ190054 TaxID=1747766 RepID=UPI00079C995A|nr:acyl-CoA dehydrogenase family protein [Mycobacterium sp. NAZ190054]KWX68749.1 hypothetical protein ASJ79_16295 [Mycobacterium sp. NAZ190054]